MSRRDLAFATGAYLSTRLALFFVAWLALAWSPPDFSAEQWRAFPGHLWLDGWVRWDSAWYRTIFEEGYGYAPGQQSNVNFFPLYPWLAGLLSLPLRPWLGPQGSFFLAAIGLAQVSSWLAVLGLHVLAREHLGRAAADRGVWLLCLFPFSFYLGAAYTEGLFLALAIWAFHMGDRGRWAAACLLASLAAITRVPGFLVAIGLSLAYVQRHGPDPRGWGREVLWFLVTPVPILLLLGYFAVQFGDPLVFVATQRESWGHTPGIHLVEQWAALTGGGLSWPGRAVTAWRVALLPALPIAVVLVWRRLGAPLGAYTLLVLGLSVSSGLQALERYLLAAFPVFVALGAALRWRTAWWAVLAVFVPCLIYFTAQFARWAPMVAWVY